ncbi:MAG: DUF6686 family protein [Bacteroidota bacterium]
MKPCKPKILVNGDYFNIAKCRCCNRIGLYYKNILIGFESIDFDCFAKSFLDIFFEKYKTEFPDGKDHIVINSAHKDIQFTFTRQEYIELKDMIQQARLLLESENILEG